MKKIIVLALISILVFAGCSGVAESSKKETTEPKTDVATYKPVEEETIAETTVESITYSSDTEYSFDDITFKIPAGYWGHLSNDSKAFVMGIDDNTLITVTKHDKSADEVMKDFSDHYDGYEKIISNDDEYKDIFQHLGFHEVKELEYKAYFDSLIAFNFNVSQMNSVYVFPRGNNAFSVEYFKLTVPALDNNESDKKDDSISDFNDIIKSVKFKEI